jgi:hypothetical protein
MNFMMLTAVIFDNENTLVQRNPKMIKKEKVTQKQ